MAESTCTFAFHLRKAYASLDSQRGWKFLIVYSLAGFHCSQLISTLPAQSPVPIDLFHVRFDIKMRID